MSFLFKVVATIRGGVLERPKVEKKSNSRDLLNIYADYQELLSEFNSYVDSIASSQPGAAVSDRRTGIHGFGSSGKVEHFDPTRSGFADVHGREAGRGGGFMSFKELQEREAKMEQHRQLAVVAEHAQTKMKMEALAAFEPRINSLLVELGLQNAEGAGVEHAKTKIVSIDLTPTDRIQRLRGELDRINGELSRKIGGVAFEVPSTSVPTADSLQTRYTDLRSRFDRLYHQHTAFFDTKAKGVRVTSEDSPDFKLAEERIAQKRIRIGTLTTLEESIDQLMRDLNLLATLDPSHFGNDFTQIVARINAKLSQIKVRLGI